MIPSRTEMRLWLLLGLLLMWGGALALGWDVWQGWHRTPDASLDVLLHQARTRVDHSFWFQLVGIPYGLLMCTRALWWVLRHDTAKDLLDRGNGH
jgi:hypothetical protein